MASDLSESAGASVPSMAIGSDVWPGLAKLSEECGELLQVVGKLAAYPSGPHPDGGRPLPERLADEVADVLAALDYLRAHAAPLVPLSDYMAQRRREKFERFQRWDFDTRSHPCSTSSSSAPDPVPEPDTLAGTVTDSARRPGEKVLPAKRGQRWP